MPIQQIFLTVLVSLNCKSKNKAACVTLYTEWYESTATLFTNSRLLKGSNPSTENADEFLGTSNSLLREMHSLAQCLQYSQVKTVCAMFTYFFGGLLFFFRIAENKLDSQSHVVPFNPHLILRCYHGRPAAYSLPSGKRPMWCAGNQSGVGQPGRGDICLDLYQGCH